MSTFNVYRLKDKIDSESIVHDNKLLKNVLNDATDTGWKNLTPTNGTWTYLQYKKIGNHVYIRGQAASFAAGTSSVTACSLPNNIVPSSIYNYPPYAFCFLAGERISRWLVYNNELRCDWAINIANGSKHTSNVWHQVNIDYWTD